MGPEALWSIEFIDNEEHHGGGIIVLFQNRVLGGNNGFVYTGDYKLKGSEILFNVAVKKFNPEVPSIYKNEFKYSAKGKYDDIEFIVTGSPDNDENFILAVQCTRQSELSF